jgi:hypothetical protein
MLSKQAVNKRYLNLDSYSPNSTAWGHLSKAGDDIITCVKKKKGRVMSHVKFKDCEMFDFHATGGGTLTRGHRTLRDLVGPIEPAPPSGPL